MPVTSNHEVSLYWEEHGAGEPLLLIMGLSLTLSMWRGMRDVLKEHFRVILFDNRGVGKSGRPGPPYSISGMAADAAAVLDAAGAESAHVFGISLGGMIAQELALRNPTRAPNRVIACTACG